MFDTGGSMVNWRMGIRSEKGAAARFSILGQKEAAQEDSFLWSMADLMTLLLIFFVLLYADSLPRMVPKKAEKDPAHVVAVSSKTISEPDLSVSPPEKELSAEQAVTEETPPLPEREIQLPPEANTLTLASEKVAEQVEPAGSMGPLQKEMVEALEDSFSNDFYVRWDEKAPVFVLGERITFDVGEAVLLSDSQSALQRMAELILPRTDYLVIVSGHTDNVTIRTPVFPSNWELSAARAASVAKFLAAHGVSPERLVIQGRAEYHPLVANTSEQNRRINRRVEISLIREAPESSSVSEIP